MTGPSLTQQLIEIVRNKAIAPSDLRQAALFVLDAVASSIAGSRTRPGEILRAWAKAQARDAGREAFLIGGLAHILEMDDLHRASVTHPGCVVVPAGMALARREGLGGHALLAAVLRGYEACCRVGMAVGPAHYRIWHNTATCGPFGSAMAAASLLDLSEGHSLYALGNAGTQSSGLWQFMETGAMSKHLHAGRAAEAGIVAADLARLGFSGPPLILEGDQGMFAAMCPDPDPIAVVRDGEGPWQLTRTSIKPWPSCRHTHPSIDAALALSKHLSGEAVRAVTVETYQAALNVCDRASPESEYEAKFSLQHCVAAALEDGDIGFPSFDPESRRRLAVLRKKIRVLAAQPYAGDYPAHWGARVTAELFDGSRPAERRRDCFGDPEQPLDELRMTAKAGRLMTFGGLSEGQSQDIIQSVLGLAEDGPVPAVFDVLSFPRGAK